MIHAQCGKLFLQFLSRGCNDRQSAAEEGPAGICRKADVTYLLLRMHVHMRLIPYRQQLQSLFALCRQGQQMRPSFIAFSFPFLFRRLFQYEMGIGTAESEGTYTGYPPSFQGQPFPAFRCHLQGQVLPVDMGVRIREMQMRRYVPVLKSKYYLYHAGDSSRRLKMSHVGLHRPDYQRSIRPPPLTKRSGQGIHLDGVAEGGTGSVGLHVTHLMRFQAAAGNGLTDHGFLGRTTGDGESARRAILVDCRAPDQGLYQVSVRQCIGEALQHHHTASFSADIPVGSCVKSLAAAVTGQHPGLAEINGGFRGQDKSYTCRQRHGAFPVSQALAGEMKHYQRRGTGGIH